MKLSECLKAFLYYQQLKNNASTTIENYNVIITKFICWATDIECSTLNADTINAYNLYLRNNIKQVSVRTYIRHIRVFVRFCINNCYCNNIYSDIIMPKQSKNIVDILTPAEVNMLLSYFDNSYWGVHDKAMVLLMLDCGLRCGEVVTLKLCNINFDYNYLKVTGKGDKERIVPAGHNVIDSINDYLTVRPASECDNLFLSCSGDCLSRFVFKKLFKKLRAGTSIKRLYPHLLRHTFATNYLLYSDGDVYKLSMLLGHSDVSTTEIYLHYANYYSFMKTKKSFSFVDSYIDNGST